MDTLSLSIKYVRIFFTYTEIYGFPELFFCIMLFFRCFFNFIFLIEMCFCAENIFLSSCFYHEKNGSTSIKNKNWQLTLLRVMTPQGKFDILTT